MSLSRHDALFKQFLYDPMIARDFLQAHLPENIKSICDFNSIEIEPGSYVDDNAKQFHSDILYSLNIDKRKGYIFCLVEHQSSADTLMAFRLLRYQIAIMQRHVDKGNCQLPVIAGIVFYHGKESPYPYSLDILDCFDNAKLATELFLKPKLIDITVIPDEEIETHKSVALLELTQKHIRDRELSSAFIRHIARILKCHPVTHTLVQNMLRYIADLGEVKDAKAFFEAFAEEAKDYSEDAMTIAEQLRQQGIKQGMQQGMQQGLQQGMQQGIYEGVLQTAKNMLAKGMDLQVIKEVTGLSDQDLSILKKH